MFRVRPAPGLTLSERGADATGRHVAVRVDAQGVAGPLVISHLRRGSAATRTATRDGGLKVGMTLHTIQGRAAARPAPRSVRRALLMAPVHPGSRYRRGRSILKKSGLLVSHGRRKGA